MESSIRKRRLIVAGCGFLGQRLADLAHRRGWEVEGWTRTEDSATQLSTKPYPIQIRDLATLQGTEPTADVVVHCASSGRGGAESYRSVYRDGMRNLIATFPGARQIFCSSTSVYAQTEGELVEEESLANPDRETGRLLLEAECLALATGGLVARIAGLYGPERSVLLRKFFEGAAVIEEGGGRWVNQAHRDDVAAALLRLSEPDVASGIYNITDDTPLPQRAIYEWLAKKFEKSLPPDGPRNPNRKRGWTNKRISNAKMRGLGWTPEFASFRDAVSSAGTIISAGAEPSKATSKS